jgi:CRP/FNR family transcriptional regulator, cyclic AMP receptor protein
LDQLVAREDVLNQGWLGRTPLPFRRAVLDRCLREKLKAGTQVYSIGDEADGTYGIVSGGLGVSIAPCERGPYIAHFAMPGTWFGEAAAIARQPRRVGIIATRNTELLHLPLHAIDEIVRRDPSAWRFFALVTNRLSRKPRNRDREDRLRGKENKP